jgi:hypothetical protein
MKHKLRTFDTRPRLLREASDNRWADTAGRTGSRLGVRGRADHERQGSNDCRSQSRHRASRSQAVHSLTPRRPTRARSLRAVRQDQSSFTTAGVARAGANQTSQLRRSIQGADIHRDDRHGLTRRPGFVPRHARAYRRPCEMPLGRGVPGPLQTNASRGLATRGLLCLAAAMNALPRHHQFTYAVPTPTTRHCPCCFSRSRVPPLDQVRIFTWAFVRASSVN